MHITAPMQLSMRLTFPCPLATGAVDLQRKCKATDFPDTSDSPGGVETAGMEIVIFKDLIDIRTRHLDIVLRTMLCNLQNFYYSYHSPDSLHSLFVVVAFYNPRRLLVLLIGIIQHCTSMERN